MKFLQPVFRPYFDDGGSPIKWDGALRRLARSMDASRWWKRWFG